VFGATSGLALFVIGIFAILLAAATLVVAITRRWSLQFGSGWLTGIGALFVGLMVRVQLNCSADPTCVVSTGTEFWIWLGAGFVAVGLLMGLVAWRRGRAEPGDGAPG